MGKVPMTRAQQIAFLETVTERHATLLSRLAGMPEVREMIARPVDPKD